MQVGACASSESSECEEAQGAYASYELQPCPPWGHSARQQAAAKSTNSSPPRPRGETAPLRPPQRPGATSAAPRARVAGGARPAAPFIIRPRSPAYHLPYPDKDFVAAGDEQPLKDKRWPTGLTLIGPQAEWSMGDWGWHVDRFAEERGKGARFTGRGFHGYFNTAYGDDVYGVERGLGAALLVACLLVHALPASWGSLLGYRGGPDLGLFCFWLFLLVVMARGAMAHLRAAAEPPLESAELSEPYARQGMIVPFSHDGVDPAHPLVLTDRVDESGRPWRGRAPEDAAATKAAKPASTPPGEEDG